MYKIIQTNNNSENDYHIRSFTIEDFDAVLDTTLDLMKGWSTNSKYNYSFTILKNGLPFIYGCTDDLIYTINFHLIDNEFPDNLEESNLVKNGINSNVCSGIDYYDQYWDVDTAGNPPLAFRKILEFILKRNNILFSVKL